jgi:hypothetical protein
MNQQQLFLQEVKLTIKIFRWRLMQMFTAKQSQFMSVLYDGRNSNCSTPIVVQMRHLVSQQLHLIGLESAGVVDDVVACWRDRSLTNRLADEEEIVAERENTSNYLLIIV